MKDTWIPSRTSSRWGDENNVWQSSSLLTIWNVEGILTKAMTSTQSTDWTPDIFLITSELTWTTWIASLSISSGIQQLSSTNKHWIVSLSDTALWNLYISLQKPIWVDVFHNFKQKNQLFLMPSHVFLPFGNFWCTRTAEETSLEFLWSVKSMP